MEVAGHPRLGESIPFPIQEEKSARQAVLDQVRGLIEEVLRRSPEWDPPPFDPRIYAKTLEIPVIPTDLPEDWDALYVPVDGKPRIVLNTAHQSFGRQNFSIAHELVHGFFKDMNETAYFLRSRAKRKYYQDESILKLERLCDLGAAELLMPRGWFEDAMNRFGFRGAAIPAIAERFAVSMEAAAVRMISAHAGPCAIGFFEYEVRPSLRPGERPVRRTVRRSCAYRVRRFFHGDGFPFLFPQGKSVSESSVIYRSSLRAGEQTAIEAFRLGKRNARLKVSSIGLHRTDLAGEPPVVCAVFRPV